MSLLKFVAQDGQEPQGEPPVEVGVAQDGQEPQGEPPVEVGVAQDGQEPQGELSLIHI